MKFRFEYSEDKEEIVAYGKSKNELINLIETICLNDTTKIIGYDDNIIKELNPKYWFIENPRGGFRKMSFVQGLPRYTVTYCQYESEKPPMERRQKPTDIWTNHPNPKFKPPCKRGAPCHAPAPRGSSTGTQGIQGRQRAKFRAIIPKELCEHIVDICEE